MASQAFLLLAFFLPLKVIILLGAEKTPTYFPLFLQDVKKIHLIVSLSCAAAACYVLYLCCEIIISLLCRHGAKSLLQKSSKLNLFENQEKIASQAYSRFTRALAAAIFFAISLITLAYIYPILAFIITIYCALALIVITLAYNSSKYLRTKLNTHYSAILNAVSAIGFLLSFLCMVADFIYFPHTKVFYAIISILVMRQGLQRLNSMILDIITLRLQHRQISALFFHSQPLLEDKKNENNTLQTLLSPDHRNAWLKKVLAQAGIPCDEGFETTWHQLDAVDVYAFNIIVGTADNKSEYLAKLFGKNISSLAQQERLLLTHQTGLPSPQWFGHFEVSGLDCHLFKLDGHKKLARSQIAPGIVAIARELLVNEPDAKLALQFSRTRPYLEQRLDPSMIEALRFACSTDAEQLAVERLSTAFPLILDHLTALPRQVVSLDTTSDALLISASEEFSVSHWSRWRMEPIGSNWPVAETKKLLDSLEEARLLRPALEGVNSQHVLLAAYLYTFERFLSRKNYPAALALLSEILGCLDTSNTPAIEQETVK
ncbi:MAG: hypothetical protein RSD81_04825 [Pseudomonas sp.]